MRSKSFLEKTNKHQSTRGLKQENFIKRTETQDFVKARCLGHREAIVTCRLLEASRSDVIQSHSDKKSVSRVWNPAVRVPAVLLTPSRAGTALPKARTVETVTVRSKRFLEVTDTRRNSKSLKL